MRDRRRFKPLLLFIVLAGVFQFLPIYSGSALQTPVKKHANKCTPSLENLSYEGFLSNILRQGDVVNAPRKVIEFLARHTDLSQDNKAEMWRKSVPVFANYLGGFLSQEIKGSDGSIVFLGHLGRALIITSDGGVYRGTLLGIDRNKKDYVWPADYTGLRRLK